MNSNFSKKKGTAIIVLLMTLCFIPAMAGAFPSGNGRPDKGFHGQGYHRPSLGIWQDPQMVQQLELTKEQVTQLRDADFSFREKWLGLRAQLDGFHLQMDKAFSEEIVNHAAVVQLAKKISDIKGKLFILDIESRLTVRKILNPGQIKKLRPHDMHQKKQGPRYGEKQIPPRRFID